MDALKKVNAEGSRLVLYLLFLPMYFVVVIYGLFGREGRNRVCGNKFND